MKITLALTGTAALLLGACGGGEERASAPERAPAATTATTAETASITAAGTSPIVPLEQRTALSDGAPRPADGTLKPRGPYIGKWSVTLTADELAAAAADPRIAGKLELELRGNGTYTTSNPLDGKQKGRYTAARGKALVFKQDSGCDHNSSFRGSRSVYRWKVNGDELVLTLIRPESRGCTGRSDILTTPRWQR